MGLGTTRVWRYTPRLPHNSPISLNSILAIHLLAGSPSYYQLPLSPVPRPIAP